LPNLSVLDNIALGPILEQTTLPEYFAAVPFIGAQHMVETIMAPINKSRRIKLHNDPQAHVERRSFKPSPAMRALDILKYYKVKRQAREMAYELLFDIGLTDRDADKYPYELSGGMRQRVSIAQALIMKPKILLMDEPFGALDHARREEMQDFIHDQWQKYNLTVLFVTHDLDEAVKVGTRLVCLSQYWTEENGQPSKGAKIVVDKKVLGGAERPSTFAHRPEFQELVDSIGRAGLNPHNCLPPSKFDLSHEDATKPSSTTGACT
jgi:ABC-type Fe3+/spermidine/putrescine transport system ATPase subunit